MLSLGAVLVDFDGTACSVDVSERLLTVFGDPSWSEFDQAVDRGEMGLREAIQAQNAMLRATRDELIEFAVSHCPLDPTFRPFIEWLDSCGLAVAIVSDGFGFYVRPILEAAGLERVRVITNEQRVGADGRLAGLAFVSGNAECVGCGTCKMQAVQRYRTTHGEVAFVGEGQTDRYGALYADLVFAKDALPAYCDRDGVPYLRWTDFDDVRRAIEDLSAAPGPVAPPVCPGWIPAEPRW
jgi:2-hydroxy-3-keto-5-methylthiopentenyl-1-phosphate phosphatase